MIETNYKQKKKINVLCFIVVVAISIVAFKCSTIILNYG